MKKRRQALILELVRNRQVRSQKELVRILAGMGIDVSQTTISRDIHELGLVKARGERGRSVYGEPESTAGEMNGERLLSRLAPEMVRNVETSHNLVVVKTSPGNAQGLAWAIDNASIPGIVGTVAGDDTIIVVCSEGVNSSKVGKKILDYATGKR